jgi:hypothetical protein
MPQTYEVEVNGRVFEVEAPSQDAAIRTARQFASPTIGAAPTPSVMQRVTDALPSQGVTGMLRGGIHNIAGLVAGASRLLGVENGPGSRVAFATTPRTPEERMGNLATDVASFAVPGGQVAKATKGAGLLTRAGVQAATAGAVGVAHEGDINAGLVPAVIAGAVPVAGAGAQAVARRVVGRALEPGAKDFARHVAKDVIEEAKAAGVPIHDSVRGLSQSKEVIGASRKALIDEALGVPRTPGYLSSTQMNQARDLMESTLAARGPMAANWQELLLWLAGGAATQSPKLGALGLVGAAGRAAATHYPAQTARALYGTGNGLLSPAVAGTAAGVASTSQRLTPEADALLQELLTREAAKAGGQ